MTPETLEVFAADVLRRARVARTATVLTYSPGPPPVVSVALDQLPQAATGQRGTPREIHGLPVLFPRFGGFTVAGPLLPGDSVLLVVADRALDSWIVTGAPAPITSDRLHDLVDAIAIPGLSPTPRPLPALAAAGMFLGADLASLPVTISGHPIRLGAAAVEGALRGTALAGTAETLGTALAIVPEAVDLATALALINALNVAVQGLLEAIPLALSERVLVE